MNDGRADWNDALADEWAEEQKYIFDVQWGDPWWVRVLRLFLPDGVVYGLYK